MISNESRRKYVAYLFEFNACASNNWKTSIIDTCIIYKVVQRYYLSTSDHNQTSIAVSSFQNTSRKNMCVFSAKFTCLIYSCSSKNHEMTVNSNAPT